MDALKAILTRRSIRKFTGEIIKDEDLQLILKAGFAAPSAHNRQPWEFVVLKDKNNIEAFAKEHPYAKMLPQAGCGIIVCGNIDVQKEEGFLVEDCSAAIQNMLIAIHALGLGAVWCGIHPKTKLTKMTKKLLNLPDSIIPVGLIAVGYKNEIKEPKDDFDEKKIHYNKW